MTDKKRVIALGFFDGVHIGHAALMRRVLEISRETGMTPAVMTFDVSPKTMVSGKNVPLINSPEDRRGLIRRLFGIEDVIFLHFDAELMHMDWQQYIDRLADTFSAGYLVAGHDFHFGYKGQGNAQRLSERCRELGLGCDIIAPVMRDGITSSSTYIRSLLAEGDISRANVFLGHPHTLTDTVRYGYRFGREIGAPTINMQFAEGVLVLPYGVYAAKVYLQDGSVYTAVTNVGVRPSVSQETKVSVESFILGFKGDLYGQQVRVEFYAMLRPEKKFSTTEELKTQIHKDAHRAAEYFEGMAL